MFQLRSGVSQAGRTLSCSGSGRLFVLLSSSTDWMRPTYVWEGDLC